ncbi:Hypothetical predicted protein [Pelobates cultripes]|uniref:Uncharacterized protein n=1 Tax=Pelobates cultripes TaxID=61616 RepID=A0AAD1TIM5_PELCU|nr:Hypothetical predicted protein [Pelobates cultripes]
MEEKALVTEAMEFKDSSETDLIEAGPSGPMVSDEEKSDKVPEPKRRNRKSKEELLSREFPKALDESSSDVEDRVESGASGPYSPVFDTQAVSRLIDISGFSQDLEDMLESVSET